jgi:hypothetical protein
MGGNSSQNASFRFRFRVAREIPTMAGGDSGSRRHSGDTEERITRRLLV